MELIELHILQSFPVTCLNRDDVGAPKSAFFGGVQRARVSSQSWKRAIREMARNEAPATFAGKRGHFVAARLKAAIEGLELAPGVAARAAELGAEFLGDVDQKHTEGHRTSVAVYLSPLEAARVAKVVADALTERGGGDAAKAIEDLATSPKGKRKKRLNELFKGKLKAAGGVQFKDAADIALFGRMVANDHSLMLEGAGLFSHALSTHAASNEVEFFSAVDETKDEVADEGAGHIGTLEFNSACYYRYVGVNVDLLRDADHLGHFTQEELDSVLATFVRSSILAVPGARKNSMFGFNPPAYVLGLRRRGQPLSLVNAFESAVRAKGDGYVKPSIDALRNHLQELRKAYGLSPDVEVVIPDRTLDSFVTQIVHAAVPSGV
jgi:CRISPR system Cascade subunit CasC